MAYNVLKGTVAGSVDQYGDQEIDGIKVFKSTISASVFYDTDAQSPCATLKDVPIQEIQGGSTNAVITYQGDKKVKSEYNLTFDGTTLKTKDVHAERLFGSGIGLKDIPSDQFAEPIGANDLNLGTTLKSVRNRLQVRTHRGIEATNDGLTLTLNAHGGLSFKGSGIYIDARQCQDVTARGQNLSDEDLLILHDASRGETRRTTLQNFYSSYINSKSLQPEGAINSVQLRSKKGLKASAAFTFDIPSKTLNVDGRIDTDSLRVNSTAVLQGDTKHCGALFHNIVTVAESNYVLADTYYTILADTSAADVNIVLPSPAECEGRVIVLKKINSNKYKLASNILSISAEDGNIDFHEKLIVKHTYSTRTLQSDGANWWIIGKTGS